MVLQYWYQNMHKYNVLGISSRSRSLLTYINTRTRIVSACNLLSGLYFTLVYSWFNEGCFWHWELGYRKLLFGGHSGIVWYAQMPNTQLPITNAQSNLY